MTIQYNNQGFKQADVNKAGDAITVQAATGSNKIQGAISYALINRENENG